MANNSYVIIVMLLEERRILDLRSSQRAYSPHDRDQNCSCYVVMPFRTLRSEVAPEIRCMGSGL